MRGSSQSRPATVREKAIFGVDSVFVFSPGETTWNNDREEREISAAVIGLLDITDPESGRSMRVALGLAPDAPLDVAYESEYRGYLVRLSHGTSAD